MSVPAWIVQNDYRERYSEGQWIAQTDNGNKTVALEDMDTPSEFYAGEAEDRRFRYLNAKHELSEWMAVHGQQVIGDVYVLEAINYFDLISFIASGCQPSDEAVVEQVREMKLSDIENPRLFYSWMGIASEFIRSEKERDLKLRQGERGPAEAPVTAS